jgi:hypothetical protein
MGDNVPFLGDLLSKQGKYKFMCNLTLHKAV